MTSADNRRFARFCIGSLVGSFAVAGLVAPVASAAPDCSTATVEATKVSVSTQAQAYMDSHPSGNQMLLAAALQPRPQAAATIAAYAKSNPQEYGEFKSILAPLGTLQSQCGVSVVPAQFQWAFDQFVG
ncbi:MAG: hemophore-related protein [Mycobacterium sp.]